MKPALALIPDEILDWTGTAAELAEQCNGLLPGIGLADEGAVANERLVRHYVQLGVLSPPARQGREALFGARQVFEFTIARFLLRDGWPLAKIAELVKTYDLPPSRADDGGREAPTAAEAAIERIRAATRLPDVVHASLPDASYASRPALEQAAAISMRRLDLGDTLRSLGNATGAPERSEVVRLELTPWCTVLVDRVALRQLGADAPDALGQALAHVLHQERIKRGE